MAVFGSIDKVREIFKGGQFGQVFDYFYEALDKNSETGGRIFSLQPGSFVKYQINDTIFAMEQSFYTKQRENCFFESHRDYVDFQLVLSGREQMECSDIDRLAVSLPFNPEKDLIKYELPGTASKFVMERGDMAVYAPYDAHMGLGMCGESCLVYKTVVKLPVELFRF